MARRILYNPVDFVEASTPFYDNLIGTITDQTDRISRNIELAREEQMRQEDREWQENMLQARLEAQRESDEARMEFQADQNAMSRHQNQMQFLGNQGMQVENLRLEWAKLGREQLAQQQKSANAAVTEATDNVNNLQDKLRQAGLVSSDTPTRLDVIQNPETGAFGVFNSEVEGEAKFIDTVEDYTRHVQPLVNFADQFLNGKNVTEWADANLAKGSDYTDVDSEQTIINYDKFMDIVHDIRSGAYRSDEAVTLLNKLTDNDPSVRLLMKDSSDANMRDPLVMAQNINSIMNTFTGVETYSGLIFKADDPTQLVDSNIEDDLQMYIPTVVDYTFDNLPNKTFKAQSIGQISETVGRLSAVAGPNDYRVNSMRDASQKLYSMAEEYLLTNPEMIPNSLRGLPANEIARGLRLNPEAIRNPSPNYEILFIVPKNKQELEYARSTYKRTNNDSIWESAAKGMNYKDNPQTGWFGYGN